MNAEFLTALDVLEKEKGINKEELIEAIESSIEQAYRKNYGGGENIEARFDRDSGEIKVYAAWRVVDEVEDENTEKTLADAQKIDEDAVIGSIIEQEIIPRNFGRIAAQNAKQTIFQKIKEQERKKIYDEYIERVGEIVNGKIDRIERRNVYVNIGSATAIMPVKEQIPTENYKAGDHIRVYIVSVDDRGKGPDILVSRTHKGLLKRLLEEEVPEIYDGVVDVESIAREPGYRSKIAVKTNDETVDPVGSCVGYKGTRIQHIIDELAGEKIDVIRYSDDSHTYIANALSPAKVNEVLTKPSEKQAYAVVDDFQFSLAIGKEGQNVRLAVKLTGWKIDIKSASEFDKMLLENPNLREEFAAEDAAEEELDGDALIDELSEHDRMDAVLADEAGAGLLSDDDVLDDALLDDDDDLPDATDSLDDLNLDDIAIDDDASEEETDVASDDTADDVSTDSEEA